MTEMVIGIHMGKKDDVNFKVFNYELCNVKISIESFI